VKAISSDLTYVGFEAKNSGTLRQTKTCRKDRHAMLAAFKMNTPYVHSGNIFKIAEHFDYI